MGKVGILVGVFEGVPEGGAVLRDWVIELRAGSGVGPLVNFSDGTIDGQMATLGLCDGSALLVGTMVVVGSSTVGGSLLSPIESEVTEKMSRKYSCICVLRDSGSSILEISPWRGFVGRDFPFHQRYGLDRSM